MFIHFFSLLAAQTQAAPVMPAQDALTCDAEIPAALALFQVPFKVIDGRVYVSVEVNRSGPFTFAIDTGASGVGRADTSLVAHLALEPEGQSVVSDGVATRTAPVTRIAELRLGDLILQDLDLVTRDYSGRLPPEAAIHGILGRDAFKDGTLVIDYPAQTVTFTRAPLAQGPATQLLAYDRPFRVMTTINGNQVEANLDTGANAELVMPKSLYARLSDDPLDPGPSATLTNGDIPTERGTFAPPINVGAVTIRQADVRVSEKFPEMMIGARILQHHRIMIDQRSQTIAICP